MVKAWPSDKRNAFDESEFAVLRISPSSSSELWPVFQNSKVQVSGSQFTVKQLSKNGDGHLVRLEREGK